MSWAPSGTSRSASIDNWQAGPVDKAIRALSSFSFVWKINCWKDSVHWRRQRYRVLARQSGRVGWDCYRKVFRKAQRCLERLHYLQRVDLMLYERQRQEMLHDLAADPYVD